MEESQPKFRPWGWIAAFMVFAIGIGVGTVLLNQTLIQTLASSKLVRIENPSMEPSYPIGTRVRYDRNAYRDHPPQVGDVVIFNAKNAAGNLNIFISRCIGTAGDVVEIRGRQLYRNGELVSEPYVQKPAGRDFKLVVHDHKLTAIQFGESIGYKDRFPNSDIIKDAALLRSLSKQDPMPVPAGQILLMGDNRAESADSRYVGPVSTAQIAGKVQPF